jgi:hypothetical protein
MRHNINVDLEGIEWVGLVWIGLAQSKGQWRALVKKAMNKLYIEIESA